MGDVAGIASAWSKAFESSVHPLESSLVEAESRVDQILNVVDLAGLDVLDYAAGPGRLAVPLAEHCGSVTLVDVNARFLLSAVDRFNQVGLSNYETVLLEDPIPDASVFGRRFDVIVCDLFLSHLSIEDAAEFVNLFGELLEDGGLLFVGQPIYETDRNPRNWQDISTWTLETFERIAGGAGLETVALYPNEGVFQRPVHNPNHFRLHVLRRPVDG